MNIEDIIDDAEVVKADTPEEMVILMLADIAKDAGICPSCLMSRTAGLLIASSAVAKCNGAPSDITPVDQLMAGLSHAADVARAAYKDIAEASQATRH